MTTKSVDAVWQETCNTTCSHDGICTLPVDHAQDHSGSGMCFWPRNEEEDHVETLAEGLDWFARVMGLD